LALSMTLPDVHPSALLSALNEFDAQYRHTDEWAGWELNRSHKFAVERDGKRYPVKMIVALATGVPRDGFSGGMEPGQAGWYAAQRGLNVVPIRRRNPDWTRDEVIVALDFYLRHRPNPPAQASEAIAELSTNLNRIAAARGLTGDASLRNPNGAYMKLMNFRSLDPMITARGQVGLSRVGARDRQIWEEFSADLDRCRLEAQRILAEVSAGNLERTHWAFCADPNRYRIRDAVRDLEFDTWTISTKQIRPGDRAVIWQTRDRSGHRGVVALAEVMELLGLIADGSPYWVDPAEGLIAREKVRVRYLPLQEPLWIGGDRTDLLRQLSVARARGGSVFYVTSEQWEGIASAGDLRVGSEDAGSISDAVREVVRGTSGGQGFGLTAAERRAVEQHAMALAKKHYQREWVVTDVSRSARFDLLCRREGKELHVEVKGTTGAERAFLLTRNEVAHARSFVPVALFLVSEITLRRLVGACVAEGGRVSVSEPWEIRTCELEPVTYECRLESS
jgi:hypothetical protein